MSVKTIFFNEFNISLLTKYIQQFVCYKQINHGMCYYLFVCLFCYVWTVSNTGCLGTYAVFLTNGTFPLRKQASYHADKSTDKMSPFLLNVFTTSYGHVWFFPPPVLTHVTSDKLDRSLLWTVPLKTAKIGTSFCYCFSQNFSNLYKWHNNWICYSTEY